jgi:hypothetical protein
MLFEGKSHCAHQLDELFLALKLLNISNAVTIVIAFIINRIGAGQFANFREELRAVFYCFLVTTHLQGLWLHSC